MNLRLAKENDFAQIMPIIAAAKEFLKKAGVDQWQTGYPNEALIQQDIQDGIAYVLANENEIGATLAIDFRGEPAYDGIRNGQWVSTNLPFAVIHRMAVNPSLRGTGVARSLMLSVESLCQDRGISSIKIDTHQENPVMNHLLKNLGYAYCGVIEFEGADRLAYEKLLQFDTENK